MHVRRQEGRRRLAMLVGVVAVASLAGAAWGISRSPLLDVDRVEVEGAVHTGAGAVRAASGIRPGEAMVDVSGASSARRVARLPWVRSVVVRREWPATVRIRVVERLAAAATRAADGGWALLDLSGRVLDHVAEVPGNLVVLEGLPPAGPPGSGLQRAEAGLLQVVAALPPALVPRVRAVAPGEGGPEGGEIELRLRPQGAVRLGRPDQVVPKLVAALAVLAAVDARTVGTVDVRIPEAPVLTRR
jgi:cell division protein FtsQ